MWRVFQGIPRAFRYCGSRPAPSTCLEEDEYSAAGTQRHNDFSRHTCPQRSQPPTTIIYRLQHADSGGSGHQGEGDEKQGPECDWQEWLRRFRARRLCDDHSLVEALGWGSALILGIEITKNWGIEHAAYHRFRQVTEQYDNSIPAHPNFSWACLHRLELHISEDFSLCRMLPIKSLEGLPSVFWPRSLTNPSPPQELLSLPSVSPPQVNSLSQSSTEHASIDPQQNDLPPQPRTPKHVTFPKISSTSFETWETKLKGKGDALLINQSQTESDTEGECVVPTPVEDAAQDSSTSHREHVPDFSQFEKSWERLQQLVVAAPHNYLGFQQSRAGNYKEAIYHWQQAADWGYDKAHYNLGVCHERGLGVEKDLVAAVHHYKLAASQEHHEAQFNLAMILHRGGSGIPVDEKASVDWLWAAAEAGLPAACRELGVVQTEDGDMESAVRLFSQAAELNDVAGQYYLGVCSEHGLGMDKNELRAAQLYGAAARKNHLQAQSALASFYETGRGGLQQDKKAALDLYMKCSSHGDKEARKVEQLTRLLEEENAKKEREDVSNRLRFSSSAPTLTRSFTHHLINQHEFLDLEAGVTNVRVQEDTMQAINKKTDDITWRIPNNGAEHSVVFSIGDVNDSDEDTCSSVDWESDSDSDSMHSDIVRNVLGGGGGFGVLWKQPQRI